MSNASKKHKIKQKRIFDPYLERQSSHFFFTHSFSPARSLSVPFGFCFKAKLNRRDLRQLFSFLTV